MIWAFLHIVFLFLAIGVTMGSEIILFRVARTRNVAAIRTGFGEAKILGMMIPLLFVVGGVLGIVAALDRDFSLGGTWLIISYVVFAVAFVVGGGVSGRWQNEMAKAAVESPDDGPSPELAVLIDSRVPMIGIAVTFGVVLIATYAMVIKPFSFGNGIF